MLRVPFDKPASLYPSYDIGVPSVVIVNGLDYNTMHPQFSVFLVDCYCSSCNENSRIFLNIFLNSIVAGLGRPDPIGIEYICNKAKDMSLLVSRHFNGTLNKFYKCFHLPIALVA